MSECMYIYVCHIYIYIYSIYIYIIYIYIYLYIYIYIYIYIYLYIIIMHTFRGTFEVTSNYIYICIVSCARLYHAFQKCRRGA